MEPKLYALPQHAPQLGLHDDAVGVINTHMRQRAMLTEEEYKKITAFMQGVD